MIFKSIYDTSEFHAIIRTLFKEIPFSKHTHFYQSLCHSFCCLIPLQTVGITSTPIHTHFVAFLFARSSSCSAFSLFEVSVPSFQSPRSPVLSFFYLYLFLLLSFSYNITPPQFRSPYLSVSTTSMFSILHLLQSFSPHGLTISVSVLLFSHLCLPHQPLLFLRS